MGRRTWQIKTFGVNAVARAWSIIKVAMTTPDHPVNSTGLLKLVGYELERDAQGGQSSWMGYQWTKYASHRPKYTDFSMYIKDRLMMERPLYAQGKNASNYLLAGQNVVTQLATMCGLGEPDNKMPAEAFLAYVAEAFENENHELHNKIYQLIKEAKLY